jgi:Spy/CpxP family protein refolding chaperone
MSLSRLSRVALVLGVTVLGFFAARAALAFGRHRDVKARISQQVNLALDAVKATQAQRGAVQAAVGEVLRTAEEAFGGAQGLPDFDEVLDLFARDRIDARAIDAIRAKREVRHKKLANALTQAFYDVHDALTREQRQQLLDYARGRASEGKHMRAFKQTLVSGFVHAQVEDVLDQLAADEHERKVVHTAEDEVVAALQKAQETKQASIDQLATLFRGDAIDGAELGRFRAEKEAQVHAITAVVEHAITQIHDGLSAEHRQKLVALVRAKHDRARQARGAAIEQGF